MYLTAPEIEVDVVVRDDAREPLGDPLELENEGGLVIARRF